MAWHGTGRRYRYDVTLLDGPTAAVSTCASARARAFWFRHVIVHMTSTSRVVGTGSSHFLAGNVTLPCAIVNDLHYIYIYIYHQKEEEEGALKSAN
jgi:hypothetical protein